MKRLDFDPDFFRRDDAPCPRRSRQLVGHIVKELYDSYMPVELTPDAAEQLAKLPRVVRARATAVLQRLEQWPAVSGAKPLRGKLAGRYRIRTGDYRLQFHLRGPIVVVERIGHRDGFYED
jgi:mRNA-degrading endonuclease RelE of RelBE toxin-antitoxin system